MNNKRFQWLLFILPAFILQSIVVCICITSCSRDDEEKEISVNNIAAEWRVTNINDGSGWTTVNKDSTLFLLSEDGFCAIIGEIYSYLNYGMGKYSFSNATATLYDDSGIAQGQCVFEEVRERTAKATIKTPSGKSIEFKMNRDESRPLNYKEPQAFLKGQWNMVKGEDSGDEGSVEFNGDKANLQINDKIYTFNFYKKSAFLLVGETNDGYFMIGSGDRPDEIKMNIPKSRVLYIFRR